MKEGLLWFDNNANRRLAEKVRQAAARYKVRMGQKPTVCYLNPDQYSAETDSVDGIALKPAATIRPNYFWIGVEHIPELAKAA